MDKSIMLSIQGDDRDYKTHNCMQQYAELCITLGHNVGSISLPDLLNSADWTIKALMQNVSNLKRQVERLNRAKK